MKVHSGTVTSVGMELLLIGGRSHSAISPFLYSLFLPSSASPIDQSTIKLVEATKLDYERRLFNHSTVSCGSIVLLCGGERKEKSELQISSDCFAFDTLKRQWKKLECAAFQEDDELPTISRHSAVFDSKENRIILFGGVTDISGKTNKVSDRLAFLQLTDNIASARTFGLRIKSSIIERRTKTPQVPATEFEIIERISSGASASVSTAIWQGEKIVVKNFFETSVDDFEAELRIMSGLNHINIVKLIGVSPAENEAKYLLMQYHPLGDLYSYMNKKNQKPFSWPTVCSMAMGIARAMRYLHSRNIIHRDLKSLNVLICSTKVTPYNVKIMDFGDAQELSHGHKPVLAGTTRWTAPEIFNKEPWTVKADVYSFGIIMWELVTLSPPFAHYKNDYQVEDAVKRGERPIVPSRAQFPNFTGYKALMTTCWSAKPTDRPSFVEIMECLKDLNRRVSEPMVLKSNSFCFSWQSDEEEAADIYDEQEVDEVE